MYLELSSHVKSYDIKLLRDKVKYISNESYFFSDTIKNNITCGKKDISNKTLEKICKLTCIHEYIESLPSGYETMITDNGMELSTGQKQRIALARALIEKPDFIILDEAIGNVDLETQVLIYNNLLKNENISVILISHNIIDDLSFDDTIYINKGRVKQYSMVQ